MWIGRAAPLVDQQRLLGELARLDAPPRRPRMRRRRDHHQLVAAELEQAQLALRHRQREHADVEIAREQPFDAELRDGPLSTRSSTRGNASWNDCSTLGSRCSQAAPPAPMRSTPLPVAS